MKVYVITKRKSFDDNVQVLCVCDSESLTRAMIVRTHKEESKCYGLEDILHTHYEGNYVKCCNDHYEVSTHTVTTKL